MQVHTVRRTNRRVWERLYSARVMSVLLLGVSLLGARPAGAAEVAPPTPAQRTAGEDSLLPQLKLETGMHTGPIELAAFDALGQLLVTYAPAAYDRTLRVWQISDGSLRQTLQIPGRRGAELVAVALCPDGQQLALSVQDGRSSVLIFDRARQQVLKRLPKLPAPAVRLTYSADGRQLVVGLSNGAVHLYEVDTGRLQAKDEGLSGAVTALIMDRSGRIVAAADQTIRLFGPGLNLLIDHRSERGGVAGLAISSDGQRIAAGYFGEPRVEVLSGYDLHVLSTPNLDGVSGSMRLVTWSPDGTALCAAGDYSKSGTYNVRCWRNEGAGPPREYAAGHGPLTALAVLGGESAAYVDKSPAWGIIAANGQRSLQHERLSPPIEAMQLDFSGGLLRIVPKGGSTPLLYSAREHKIAASPAADRRVRPPADPPAEWKVVTSQDPPALNINGQHVALAADEVPVRWAAAADGQWGATATTQALLLLEPSGKLRRRIALPAAARAVQISGNGRLVIASLIDGSVRWYSSADGEERLAFSFSADGNRWIAWTRSGYYDTSLDGESLLGWEVPRGEEVPADFFRVGLLRETYYRPDIIARVLFAASERVACEEADAALENPTVARPLRKLLPPVVRVLEPKEQTAMNSREVTVRVMIRSPSGEPIQNVWQLVQGRREQSRGIVREKETEPAQLPPTAEHPYTFRVTIPPEDSTIAIFAQTATTKSEPALVRVRWTGSRTASSLERPQLYMLSVGVSAYPSASLRLAYPAKDALDLAAAFKEQEGKRYQKVEVMPLVDKAARRNDILAGLEWLAQSTSSKDVAVLFLAGHGVTNSETGRYSFLPIDFDSEAGGHIDGPQLQLALSRIRGRVLLFLDTCHAGGVLGLQRASSLDLIRLTNELTSADSGIIVYAASTGDQASREASRWGNGAFSKAAVEGLRGKADPERSGLITTTTLDHYISQRVRELTDESQTPTTAKPNTAPEYLLAVVPVRKPLYQRWWIWGAAGLAAAAIVTGAVVAAAPWQERPQVVHFE